MPQQNEKFLPMFMCPACAFYAVGIFELKQHYAENERCRKYLNERFGYIDFQNSTDVIISTHPIEGCTCRWCLDGMDYIVADLEATRKAVGRYKPVFIAKLANFILHKYWFVTFGDTENIYHYNPQKGFYTNGGEVIVQQTIQEITNRANLKCDLGNAMVAEVMGHIKRSTYQNRDEFKEPVNKVCIQNGIYDIFEKTFVPHSPEFKFLSKLGVAYDAAADCTKIKRFLGEILLPDDIPIAQELFGYLLLRDYRFQQAFMFNGTGSNGKSTLLSIMERFLGDGNMSHIPLQDIAGARFGVAQLYQKYANIYADISAEELKNTGKFKMLTGGDTIDAELKFKDHFGFQNFAKLIFSCNTLPRSYDDSDAFFRRWVILDFRNQFVGANDKKNLKEDLSTPEELSGLFNYAVEGLARILANNTFSYSKTVDELREEYIRKSDSVTAFLMDDVKTSIDGLVVKQDLFSHYLKYCGDHKLTHTSERGFFMRLAKMFKVEESQATLEGKRVRVIRGIMLKERVVSGKLDVEEP